MWFGADINAKDGTQGLTALHYAVIRKDINLLSFLLYECENIDLNATCFGGLTAYKISRDKNIIEMFHQRGVTESPYQSEDEFSSESEDDEVRKICIFDDQTLKLICILFCLYDFSLVSGFR